MYLKLTTFCLIFLCATSAHTQFSNSSEINNSTDFLYEISNSTCDPNMEMVAGIRIGVNGNFNTDQLVFGKLDLNTGNLNQLTTYPSNLGSHFNALENVEMTASKNNFNNSDGHVMVFSVQDIPNGEFNLHIIKIDCNGNLLWSLNPYDGNGFSEHCNEIFQDSNGDYILAGYREGGGLTREPLVLKVDLNGGIAETKILHVDQNGNGSDDFAFATDIIEVSGTSTNAKYAIAGSAGSDAFIITLDNIFDPLDHSFYDIDNNASSGERISQITQISGSFWATGVGNLGASGGRYTFVINVNAISGFVPILNLNWAKKYQLNNLNNYPGDLLTNASGNGVVIAGTLVSTSTAINFPTKGYMIEVLGGGTVNFAWEQNKSTEFGALLELERRGNEYLAGGYFSGSASSPASSFKFLKTDTNGETGGCQEALQASDLATTVAVTAQIVSPEDFNEIPAFWGFNFGSVMHTQLDCDEGGSSFVINVFKYEDINCDGAYTPGVDTPLPTWTIEVRDNTNALVSTGTTDASGNFSASLPAGTYTVSEILTAPWQASSTNAPAEVVTINAGNPSVQVDFGNKNPQTCSCIDQRIVDNGNCCYEILIDNNYGAYYDEIRVSLSGIGSLVNATPNAGWNMTQTGNILIYTHNSGLIPTGNSINLGLFCTKGIYGMAPIKIQWLKNGDLQCESDLEIDCPCPEEPSFALFDKNIKVQNDLSIESLDLAVDVIQDPMGNYVYAGIQYIEQIDPSGVLVNVPLPYLMKSDPSGNIILGPVFIDLIGNQLNTSLKVQIENHFNAGAWTGYSIAMDGIKNGKEYIHLTYLDDQFKKLCERPIYLNNSDLRFEDYVLQGSNIFITGREDKTNDNLLLIKVPAQVDCLNDFYQIASYPGLEKGVSIATNGLTTPLFVTGKKGNRGYVIKVDQSLNLINYPTGNNTKLFNLNNNSNDPIDIDTKASGNFVVAGNMTHNATNDQEYFILEHNENGNFIGYNFNRYDTPEDNLSMTEMKLDPVNGNVAIVGTKDDQTTAITTDRLSHSMVLTSIFDEVGHANYVFGPGYREGRSQAFDFASDGGLIIAHSVVNDPCVGTFCLDEFDSRITKTGQLGYLDDCECYYPSCSEKIEEIDVFTEVNESGIIIGAVFAKDSIGCKPLLKEETICRAGGGIGSVCMISTTATVSNTDSCCLVSLDLINNNPPSSSVHKIQIDLLGPAGLYFDFVNSNGPLGFQIDPGQTTPTRIVLLNSAGIGTALPTGNSRDYVNFCYGNSTSGNLPNQQLKISYLDGNCALIPDCMDTLNTTCVAIPFDDDCYEVNTISFDCDSLPNLFLYCFEVTNYNANKTLKWIEFNNTSSVIMTPASPYCLTSPVAPLSTGSQECVYLYDYSGLPLPRPIKLFPEMQNIDSTFCCNDLDSLCLILPNCCDPCDTTWVQLDPLTSMQDSCCFTLDIYNNCDFTLTKIITESLTPGVNLGSVYLGGPNAGQWTLQRYTGSRVEWKPTSPTAPKGFSDDLINFCLDDSLGTLNQDVAIHYVMQSSVGLDSIACSDTLRFSCSRDIKCLELVRDSVYCDMNGNYFVDVKLMNVSSPSFIADRIDVNYTSAQNLFPVPTTFNVTPFGPGAMTTVTMQIMGIPNALPGQQIDLSFMMHDNLTPPLDTCCWESVDLSVTLPPCPNCCDDFQAFCNDITFQSNIYGLCDTGYVDIMFADTCTYADIDWGDGTTESRQGAFSARHLYSAPGQYIVCADFKESSDGGLTFCWNKQICDTLNIATCPPSSSALLCDSIMWDTLSVHGFVAATCYYELNTSAPVLTLKDIRKHQNAPRGIHWSPTASPSPLNTITGRNGISWDGSTLGSIFGIAVDPYGNAYVASSGLYPITAGAPITYGIAGGPAIYKVNMISGAVTIVADNLPQQLWIPGQNRYLGFGNIAYNYRNNLVYVTNLEDGNIYALDANGYNVIVDIFNYNIPDNGLIGYPPLNDAIFGVGYNHVEHSIYFGDYRNDTGNRNGQACQIFKVDLNPVDGKFSGRESFITALPFASIYPTVSNPASDISFSASGEKMLVSQRTINGGLAGAHESTTVEYYKSGGLWVAEPISKYASRNVFNENAVGGNDYTYGDSLFQLCDTVALVMEDAIEYPVPLLYGFRGIPATGSSLSDEFYVDLDNDLTTNSKQNLGDLEVFRDLCCLGISVSICDTLDWSGFDIALDSNCVGGIFPDVTIVTSTGFTIPDWVEYDYGCDNSVDAVNTGAPYLGVIVQNISASNFSVCATAYKVINGDTCKTTVTKSIVLPPCPTTTPDCCDSLAIYGNFNGNLPDQIKVYGSSTYISSHLLNLGSPNIRPIFSKFDANNNLVWEVQIDDLGRLLDFTQTDDGGFLLVGRSEPARTGTTNFDNHSILAKVDANGSLVYARAIVNAGREGFLKIVKSPNPANPMFPYYIGAIENYDGFTSPATAFDEFHLYNIDDLGNINFNAEYKYRTNTNTATNDDQWQGMIALANGDLLILGDYDPGFFGTFVIANGLDGTLRGFERQSSAQMRYYDAVESSNGNLIIVGRYQDGSNDAAIVLMDANYNYLSSLRYTSGGIPEFREIHMANNNEFFTVGQGQNDLPIIFKFEIDASNQIVELESKYWLDGETAFSSPRIFTSPSHNRLYYADARQGNAKSFGNYDVIYGSFSKLLDEDCLKDTALLSAPDPFIFNASSATVMNKPDPLSAPTPAVDPNLNYDFLCYDNIADCSGIDWSPFGFSLAKDCNNIDPVTGYPQVDIIPTFGSLNLYKIDYDVADDGTVELSDMTFGPLLHPAFSNPNLYMSATAYIILANGDTCTHKEIRDLFVEPCPAFCCISQAEFDADVETVSIVKLESGGVEVRYPDLNGCHEVSINWGDDETSMMMGSSMMTMHMYGISGDYNVEVNVREIGDDGNACFETSITQVITGINDLPTPLEFKVYPNPFEEDILVEFNTSVHKIEIYNLHGQRIQSQSVFEGETKARLSLSNLVDGIYIVRVYGDDGKEGVKRIIKM